MKTLVVGLGNPTPGDDGVGWKVAEKIKQQLPHDQSVVVDCLSFGGISLMERLIGYHRVNLIDAFASDGLGSIHVMKLIDIPNYSAFHISSAQDTSLQNALEIGRSLGAYLPEDIIVVGIATPRICDFSDSLSPLVAEALMPAVKIVLDLLKQAITTH